MALRPAPGRPTCATQHSNRRGGEGGTASHHSSTGSSTLREPPPHPRRMASPAAGPGLRSLARLRRCAGPLRAHSTMASLVGLALATVLAATALLHFHRRTPPARVCLFTADPLLVPTSRGSAEALWNLVVSLSRKGHRVHAVVLSSDPGQCVASLNNLAFSRLGVSASCEHSGGSGDGDLAFLHGPRGAALQHSQKHGLECDVLLSHEWLAPLHDVLVSRVLEPDNGGRLGRGTAVVNVHGGALWSRSWETGAPGGPALRYLDVVEDAFERTGAALADVVVFPSSYMAGCHREWPLPAVHVVPNLLPADRQLAVGRTSGAVPFSGVAYAGAVDKRKGIDTLVHTLASLRASPPVQLHVYGALGWVGAVRAGEYIAAALEGEEAHVNATVHGPVNGDALWPALKDQHLLLVMPSLLENQPMTVVNAHIHGIPTLVYDVGGVAEMLEPGSRDAVMVAPRREALKARLEEALDSGTAHVPVLHPSLLQAERKWRRVVEKAAVDAGAPRRRQGAHNAARRVPAFATVRWAGGDTVGTVAAAAQSHAVVLLLPDGMSGILPGEEPALQRLAAQLQRGETPTVAGATGLVLLGQTATYPDPPYFFLAHGFVTCVGAEAPLLVRTDALVAFAAHTASESPFRQWLFAAWLLYAQRRVVARLPRPLFTHSGLVDSDRCFYSNQGTVPRPEELLANASLLSSAGPGGFPSPAAMGDFPAALRATCAEYLASSPNAAEWLVAAGSPGPRLCNASTEHGLFTLATLKTVLLKSCGAYCAFPVGDMLPPPTPSLAWGLDTVHGCWQEVSGLHPCAQWYAGRPRVLPGVLPPLPTRGGAGGCGGNTAWCEPITVVAHVEGCLPRSAAAAFNGVSASVLASSGGKPANPGLLLRSGGVSAAQTRQRFPAARIVLLVCNPFERLAAALEAWQRAGDHQAALRFHNVTTLDDAVDVAAPDGGRCVGSDSLGRRGDAVRHCDSLLTRLVYPGMYALTAYDWISQFGAGNVTVLDAGAGSEQLEGALGEVWGVVAPLLGEGVAASRLEALQPGTRKRLGSLYAAQAEWLASLTGRDFPRDWARRLG